MFNMLIILDGLFDLMLSIVVKGKDNVQNEFLNGKIKVVSIIIGVEVLLL